MHGTSYCILWEPSLVGYCTLAAEELGDTNSHTSGSLVVMLSIQQISCPGGGHAEFDETLKPASYMSFRLTD